MPAHTNDQWLAWGEGTELGGQGLVAKDMRRPGHPIVYIPPAGADSLVPGDDSGKTIRTLAREGHLHCPAPGCGPFSSAVGGPKVRHHFRHAELVGKRGIAHDPESLWHQTAKQMIADWIGQRAAGHVVAMYVDEHRVSTRRGDFEPDVYVELDTGARIAVEVQFSPGDLSRLVAKHEGYRDAGVAVWWVYGSWPQTFCRTNAGSAGDARVKLIGPQRQLLQFEESFFWFNVSQEAFAVPYVSRNRVFPDPRGELWDNSEPKLDKAYRTRPWRSACQVRARAVPLSAATVDLGRAAIAAPFLDEMVAGQTAYDHASTVAHAQARLRFQARQAELEAQARHAELAEAARHADLEAQAHQSELEEEEIQLAMKEPAHLAQLNAEFEAELAHQRSPASDQVTAAQAVDTAVSPGAVLSSHRGDGGPPAAGAREGFFSRLRSRLWPARTK